jgi:hypothetical protein
VSDPKPPDVAGWRAALAASKGHGAADADAERIFSALHGQMSPEQRRAVIDELLASADGLEAWRLAMELAPPGAQPAAAAWTSPAWRWMPLAAALVIMVAGSWFVLAPRRTQAPPVYRSLEDVTIASALPDGAPLARANAVLRWTPVEGARYHVRVLTAALEPLDEADGLTTAEYRVRPESLATLPSGATLLWQVEARIPGRGTVASPTFSTQLE